MSEVPTSLTCRVQLQALLTIALLSSGCSKAPCGSHSGPEYLRRHTSVQIIGHRGASALAPEHTFAAYDLAVQARVDYLEIDVHLTEDDVPVAIHDATLDRTARPVAAHGGCRGPVRQQLLSDLRLCEFGSWFNETNPNRAQHRYVGEPIPTLEDILARYEGKTAFYIELKAPDSVDGPLERSVADIVMKYRHTFVAHPKIVIQAFSHARLQRISGLVQPVMIAHLFNRAAELHRHPGLFQHAAIVGLPLPEITSSLVETLHRDKLLLHAFQVKTLSDFSCAIRLGVDGVILDDPGIAHSKSPRDTAPNVI